QLPSPHRDGTAGPLPNRQILLMVAGLAVFHLSLVWPGNQGYVWMPAAGIALALTAWIGLIAVVPLGIDYLAAQLLGGQPFRAVSLDALVFSGQIALSWWCYHRLALGTRRLEDPRSA